jgi:hypothetical protein
MQSQRIGRHHSPLVLAASSRLPVRFPAGGNACYESCHHDVVPLPAPRALQLTLSSTPVIFLGFVHVQQSAGCRQACVLAPGIATLA